MGQNKYLQLSKDGTTVINCDKDYKGVVVIPNGVTQISKYAFADYEGLNSIEIPESVTMIGDEAFSGCMNLNSIEIPNSIKGIGRAAFKDC